MARWQLKKGAPRHYIRGVGLVRFGDAPFEHPGPPESEWWERLDAPAKGGKPPKPVAAPVPDPAPAPASEPAPGDDSGTF